MLKEHRIRLREPWLAEQKSHEVNSSGLSVNSSVWAFSRRFNAPTGLTDDQQLWLCVWLVHGQVLDLEFNGHLLDLQQTSRADWLEVDVRAVLKPFNKAVLNLQVDTTTTSPTLSKFCEVELRIRG
ncbi:MAG: hypothetical protein R3C53_23300 [Pirellulaceae bacterium]